MRCFEPARYAAKMKPFLHQRLAKSLLIEAASGLYDEGAPFLSLRKIRKEWTVSRDTVDRAFDYMVKERILERRDRRKFILLSGGMRRARLLLGRNSISALAPPSSWTTRRKSLLDFKRTVGHRLALIVDGPVNVPALKRKGFLHAFDTVQTLGSIPWHLVAFLQQANRAFAEVDILVDDGSPDALAIILGHLDSHRVDGAAVFRRMHAFPRKQLFQQLKKRRIPAIAVFDDCEGEAEASVDFNNLAGGFEAMKQLVGNGHRDILVLSPLPAHPRFEERLQGALAFLEEARPSDVSIRLERISRQNPVGKALRRHLGSKRVNPTGLLSIGLHFFLKGRPTIEKLGIRIPRDLSVIGIGSHQLMVPANHWIDLVEQDFGKVGTAAALHLIDLVEGRPVPHTVQIEMPYLKRKSMASKGSPR